MTNNRLIQMAKHAKSRWKAKTPAWFKFIIRIGVTLMAIGTGVLALQFTLPSIITTIAGYFVVVGIVISAVAKTAVDNE